MSVWTRDVPVEGSTELPPDPRALDALGRNHSLETALADLVDNSIDADADRIRIRFIRHRTRLVGLYVVDNGTGIRPDTIDAAMTVGGRRDYSGTDLGRFGVGLKAASFSQAASLTVMSRAAGYPPVGRRWLLKSNRRDYRCDIVTSNFVDVELNRNWPVPTTPSGTVVRWDEVVGFPSTDDSAQVEEFLTRTISHLQGHLGLTFHRIITRRKIRISIDVEDTESGVGIASTVSALDPFAYPGSPPGWPKDLRADVDGSPVVLRCHIWPGRSSLPEYRLPGGAEQRQGLYVYRHDRLLHAGGWEGVHAADRRLQLARVEINIDGDAPGLFTMNPEKTRVAAGPLFARTVARARADDGTDITAYLQAAEAIWTTTNQRTTARRRPVVPPGRGLHPKVTREIRDELPQLNDEPVNLLWKALPETQFIEVDRESNTLWLNRNYRPALLNGRRGGLNDLPVLKTLLYLLAENTFQGAHLGPRDKDNIELWQSLLTAAARAERAAHEERR
ncbi:ATP-binding protein [Micromonospora sp. DT233]|uniref:ATP-binding protein n=1 Tax=Micromonospora sp. DT233 TaxID=3393432 RepID=UPI003CED0663